MQISLNDIGKKYGDHWIFRHFNAHFEIGQVYGIIGNNGSGKSTMLQIISGFVTPNQGTITMRQNGGEVAVENYFKHLSFTAPYQDLFEEFTVLESVELHRKMKPLRVLDSKQFLAEIELIEHKNKPLQQLSSGMKQRLKLALTLYSKSGLVLLDEPCSNLDQKWTDWYNSLVLTYAAERITIICSNSQAEELKHCTVPPIDISAIGHL